MVKSTIICDNCGGELRRVKSQDIFGNETEIIKYGLLNIFGTPQKINGIDLCEQCADEINKRLLAFKMEHGGITTKDAISQLLGDKF